jgi:hypothetical protein
MSLRIRLGVLTLASILLAARLILLLPPDGIERAEWAQLIARFRPLPIHFPIAFVLLAAVFELVRRSRYCPQLRGNKNYTACAAGCSCEKEGSVLICCGRKPDATNRRCFMAPYNFKCPEAGRFKIKTSTLFCLLLTSAITLAEELPRAKPESVGMSSERLERIGAAIQRNIDDKRIAGAVALVMRRDRVVWFKPQGMMDHEAAKPMQPDTIFRINAGSTVWGWMSLDAWWKSSQENPWTSSFAAASSSLLG